MKRLFIIVSAFFILGIPFSYAHGGKDTLNILFVGNSYTYYGNLPKIVSIISDHSATKLITKKSTTGGAKLREHWNGEKGLHTKELIKDGHFDIVVLQEQSMGAINRPDSIIKYSRLFCDYIREQGAKPYLYLTWARENAPQNQKIINKVYEEVASENDAVIIPVGKAWELARQLRPDICLYKTDKSHPNDLGTFLTACVFVAAICHEIPDNLQNAYNTKDADGESINLMNLGRNDVLFCKKVAEVILLKGEK